MSAYCGPTFEKPTNEISKNLIHSMISIDIRAGWL
jgi:hypothetical protein